MKIAKKINEIYGGHYSPTTDEEIKEILTGLFENHIIYEMSFKYKDFFVLKGLNPNNVKEKHYIGENTSKKRINLLVKSIQR